MSKLVNDFFKNNKPIFITGVAKEENLPNSILPEFAFIGRSNVGKSSLINAITNSKIAIISKTPGRTKELNFFQIANKLTLVDMPGFGYAKSSKKDVENWNDLIIKYLLYRKNLKRAFLLIDGRLGV
ncbi:MAG: ribosome biogenesis GTP-binding protein YihA/YsxC, partial [Rickettsiales bacterium]|nr:ribosome biogenesis GTP-binding protein YihA/YsxC [Rickettsiales bacterium]